MLYIYICTASAAFNAVQQLAPFALGALLPKLPFVFSYAGRLQVLDTTFPPPQVGKPRTSAAVGEFPDQHGGCEEHPQEEFELVCWQVTNTTVRLSCFSFVGCRSWYGRLSLIDSALLFVTFWRFVGSTLQQLVFNTWAQF